MQQYENLCCCLKSEPIENIPIQPKKVELSTKAN